jgi:hypothetical protein
VAVDDGEVVVVVLLTDEAAGVLAERAHLIAERFRIADQLALIEDGVDLLHDLVAHFHAYADVDGARAVLNAVALAELLQPVRAAAAGGNDGLVGLDLILSLFAADLDALADVSLEQQIVAFVAEEHSTPFSFR